MKTRLLLVCALGALLTATAHARDLNEQVLKILAEVPLIDGWEVTPSGVSIQQRGGVGEHTVGQSVARSSEEDAAKARDLAHEPRLPLHGLVLLEHLQDLMDGEIFIQSEP